MDGGIVLIILIVLGAPLVVAIWLIVRAVSARNEILELRHRVGILEREVLRLRERTVAEAEKAPTKSPATEIIKTLEATEPSIAPPPPIEPTAPEPPVFVAPPPLPPEPIRPVAPPILFEPVFKVDAPPPIPEMPQPARAPTPAPGINWEQFMGVKLFAWIGGFALFLGIAFFVKYSFDNNLISPQMRVALSFLAGLGLVFGGTELKRKAYAVTSQTLCATGIVILYATTYAAHASYLFP